MRGTRARGSQGAGGRIVERLVPARLGRPFRRLLVSSWTTNLGDGIALAAGPLLVASLTDDAFLVALAALLRWAPPLVFGLAAGVASDRYDRRRLVIGANVARAVVLGLAPWHGRVLVLDRDDAQESTGHGSPLPVLVHGGPGRAGGGEELGGIRGVLHHMQRTAVQASPDVMTAVTGRWATGAARHPSDVHPFRKPLERLRIGDTVASAPRTVTREDIDRFAELTGDTFYAHTDPEAAARNPLFGGIVAHGYLVVSLAAGLFVEPSPGPVLANFGVDNLRFLTPVKAGDTIDVLLTVKQVTPRTTADYGEVRWDATVRNQDGAPVATYDVLTLVAKQEAGPWTT